MRYSISCNENKLLITEHGENWSKGSVIDLKELSMAQIDYLISTLQNYKHNNRIINNN